MADRSGEARPEPPSPTLPPSGGGSYPRAPPPPTHPLALALPLAPSHPLALPHALPLALRPAASPAARVDAIGHVGVSSGHGSRAKNGWARNDDATCGCGREGRARQGGEGADDVAGAGCGDAHGSE